MISTASNDFEQEKLIHNGHYKGLVGVGTLQQDMGILVFLGVNSAGSGVLYRMARKAGGDAAAFALFRVTHINKGLPGCGSRGLAAGIGAHSKENRIKQ